MDEDDIEDFHEVESDPEDEDVIAVRGATEVQKCKLSFFNEHLKFEGWILAKH
jgi:hypothetical protein